MSDNFTLNGSAVQAVADRLPLIVCHSNSTAHQFAQLAWRSIRLEAEMPKTEKGKQQAVAQILTYGSVAADILRFRGVMTDMAWRLMVMDAVRTVGPPPPSKRQAWYAECILRMAQAIA